MANEILFTNADSSFSSFALTQNGTQKTTEYPEIIRTGNPLLFQDQFLDEGSLIENERQLYEQNKELYLGGQYENKYIALLNGQLIGFGADLTILAKEVFALYPRGAIYFPFVTRNERQNKYKMGTTKVK